MFFLFILSILFPLYARIELAEIEPVRCAAVYSCNDHSETLPPPLVRVLPFTPEFFPPFTLIR